MLELLKKYWFICFVTILLVIGVAYFAASQTKIEVRSKVVNNENVLFSINGDDITANEFYDMLYKLNGINTIAQQYQYNLTNKEVETTQEMQQTGIANKDNTIQQVKGQYGADYEKYLTRIANNYGLDDYNQLDYPSVLSLKINQIIETKFKEFFVDYQVDNKPRILRHILISMEDPNNPTQEQLDTMALVDEALLNGEDFKDVAIEYSNDTSNASNGGLLGFNDINTVEQYVEPFREPCLSINEKEYTDWVTTEFGRHLIYVDATDFDNIYLQYPTELMDAISVDNVNWAYDYFTALDEKHELTFVDSEVEKAVIDLIDLSENIKDSQEDKQGEN